MASRGGDSLVSTTEISLIIGVIAFLLSVSVSMFISGTRWGRLETKLDDLQEDRVRKSDIKGFSDRLSRIEGMFTLTLKDGDYGRNS